MSASARPWTAAWAPLAAAAAGAMRHARGRSARGAAVEDEAGAIHVGASIRVTPLPPSSLCAEQIAIAAMCVEGRRRARRIIVVGAGPAGAPAPCGRCLQNLIELGADAEIRWGTPTEERGRAKVTRLLPLAFRDYRSISDG